MARTRAQTKLDKSIDAKEKDEKDDRPKSVQTQGAERCMSLYWLLLWILIWILPILIMALVIWFSQQKAQIQVTTPCWSHETSDTLTLCTVINPD